MTIAQLQSKIAEREQYLLWLERQHSFVMNSAIKAKYAHHISDTVEKISRLKEQLNTTLVLGEA